MVFVGLVFGFLCGCCVLFVFLVVRYELVTMSMRLIIVVIVMGFESRIVL